MATKNAKIKKKLYIMVWVEQKLKLLVCKLNFWSKIAFKWLNFELNRIF